MNNQHQKDKLHFQIERIAFFSDALIAIAVTLLVIEIKAPHIEKGASFTDQVNQLIQLLPEFISFLISFAIIVSQWTRHHELFGNLINYDPKLITLNSCFLFTVAIIPFSTSYFAYNNVSEFSLPYIVYATSLILLTLFNYLLFRHSVNKKNNLYSISYTNFQIKWLTADYLLFPVSIILSLAIGFFSLKAGLITYAVIMQLGFYINKQKRKTTAR